MSEYHKIPEIKTLKFAGVTFAHEGQTPLLRQVDFDFPMNEIVWIKGAEGQGKSSLLQILAGLQFPQLGAFYINDQNVLDMTFEEFLPLRLAIGYTFDYGGLINNRTVSENLLLPLNYHKMVRGREAAARVDGLIERFELKKYAKERPASVPGRVRKLTCLLRALVMRPQLLLMDDPSVGLGQDTLDNFVDYIHELRADGCLQHIFMSTYDEKYAAMLNYQIIHLDEGQMYLQPVDPEKKVAHL